MSRRPNRRPGARLAVSIFLAAWSGSALASGAADPTGVWLVQDGIARVRIEKCGPQGESLCGYTVWLKKALDDQGQPRRDTENPDPSRKGQPVLGHQNLMALKPTGDDQYQGKVYNVDNGRFYDATVTASSANPDKLALRGCMMGILCASQNWQRVTDIAPGQLVVGSVGGKPSSTTKTKVAPARE